MSVHATTWVWDHATTVTGSTLLVLLAIADAANREGEGSCQAVGTLARMARVSESTVHRAIRDLREGGLIEHTGVSGRYRTNVYSLPLMGVTPVTGDTCQSDTPVTSAPRPLSPMTPDPIEITPSTSSSDSSEVKTTRATGALVEVEPATHPSRPIPHNWQPRPIYARWLMRNYPGIDLRESARRFRAHHFARQDTSRSWEASLSVWVSQDWQRWSEQQGTDDLGVPRGQRARSTTAPQPGDPGYVDPEELLALARGEVSVTETEEHQ
jgi:DNA-binding Lrp family transcriptional regulator